MTIDTRTEADYYHDVATTVGDVAIRVRAKKVEYHRDVVVKKFSLEASCKLDRRTELPDTYIKWDNAVLRDARTVTAVLASETARIEQELA